MVRGITRFKCNGCGHKFTGLDMEWNATIYTAPVRCPQCGSMHTYPVGLMNFFGIGGPFIYKKIWKLVDEEMLENQ